MWSGSFFADRMFTTSKLLGEFVDTIGIRQASCCDSSEWRIRLLTSVIRAVNGLGFSKETGAAFLGRFVDDYMLVDPTMTAEKILSAIVKTAAGTTDEMFGKYCSEYLINFKFDCAEHGEYVRDCVLEALGVYFNELEREKKAVAVGQSDAVIQEEIKRLREMLDESKALCILYNERLDKCEAKLAAYSDDLQAVIDQHLLKQRSDVQ